MKNIANELNNFYFTVTHQHTQLSINRIYHLAKNIENLIKDEFDNQLTEECHETLSQILAIMQEVKFKIKTMESAIEKLDKLHSEIQKCQITQN